jgi:dTDP-4-dehydrorhamnose 3,5-epimerase
MHFQRPPHHHAKLVYCAHGCILDAVVDLRVDGGGFGNHLVVNLSSENGWVVYLPPGVAHGFYALSDEAVTVYKVTSEYSPESDDGVRWDSCGIAWPSDSPIVSDRDSNFPVLNDVKILWNRELGHE